MTTRTTPQGDPADFPGPWRRVFGAAPPLGWALRGTHGERWTRFHALPGSERYARTPAERAIIRARANALATEVLGPRADIWIACARYPGVPPDPDGPERRLGMGPAMTWRDPEEDPGDQVEIAFHVARFSWAPGSLDRLFDEVAEDLADALLFAPGRGAALAPYAGGFDVFLPSAGELDRIEARHADWMSDRPDRL